MTEIPFELLISGTVREFTLCYIDRRFDDTRVVLYDLKKGGDPGWQGDASVICEFIIKDAIHLQKFIQFLQSEDFILWKRHNEYAGADKYWVKREYESPSMSYNQHEEWAANYHAS